MALVLGREYALARKTAWWFPAGPGRGTAVLTHRALYIFPERTLSGDNGFTRTRTIFTIGNRPPVQAIEMLVNHPAISAGQADAELERWATQVHGPVLQPMASVRRIRIFDGWLRRGVAFSEKASGYDVRPKAVHPAKVEMQAFIELLREHPGLEMK